MFLLPQLEQPAIYDGVNPTSRPLADAADALARGGDAELEVFRCPSFDGPPQLPDGLGRSNTLASSDVFSRKTKLTQIRDGMSTTVAVGETVRDQAWVLPGTGSGTTPPNRNADFGSGHGQVTHFLFCDGSVRPIPDSIPAATFQALFTVSGQEAVGDF
ncbi:MAG: DUF1559 domain-containing protein [Planctomycetaceae bacterium]|nr:DUF1559 domain-containing protein [Planctomycetaceae bacterium]